MIAKIKEYGSLFLGALTLVLGGLLFSQRRKTERAESDLAKSLSKNATQENDHDREIAKMEADELVSNYERLKRQYDGEGSGEGKL